MTQQTKNAIASGAVVLRRLGQFLQATPPCPELRAALRTAVHVLALRGSGIGLGRDPENLYRETIDLDEPVLECFAGLQPVVRKSLLDAGYGVKTNFKPAPALPEPELAQVKRMGSCDTAFLALVRSQERALIQYVPARVDAAWLTVQLAIAWPALSIAVVASRIAEAHDLRHRLLRHLPGVVAVSSRDRPAHERVGRVVVATYNGLGHTGVEIEKRDLVVVLNALEASRVEPLSRLGHARRARIYGLLPLDRRLAPFDQDAVRLLFGFQEETISEHGQPPVRVEVVKCRHVGGTQLSEDLSLLEVKRRGLWHNPVRNRRVSALAQRIRSGNLDRVRDSFLAVAEVMSSPKSRRVAILVENVEHAIALSRLLPNWQLVAGNRVWSDRRPGSAPACSAPAGQDRDNARGIIMTWVGMERGHVRGIEVLVRADGGQGMPPLPAPGNVEGEKNYIVMNVPPDPSPPTERRLLLVDFDDRHHAILRHWSRQRWAAYAEQGWYAPGVDPVEARIERFLATRPNLAGKDSNRG